MGTKRRNDRDYLQACIRGNDQAFTHLVEKYQSLVCAITYSGTGRFDTSEELAQEAFLLAWRNLKQIKDLDKFQAWLCQRIARARGMLRDQVATMVETTLTRSRPDHAFTAVVMASIAGTAMKGTVASAALVQAGWWGSGVLSSLISGTIGKVALVAAGVAIVVGGVTLHRHRANNGTSQPTTHRAVDLGENDNTSASAPTPTAMPPQSGDTPTPETHALSVSEQLTPIPTTAHPEHTSPLTASKPEVTSPPVLSGKAVDRDTGEPIPGLIIRISPGGGGLVEEAATDHRGVYAFPTVRREGTYNIRLKTMTYITPAEWDRPRETVDLYYGKPVVHNFALEKGCRINIKAVNEKQQPVQGVHFYAVYTSDDMGRGPKDSVRTDAKGVTLIGGLRPDEYLIVGAHRDYALVGRKVRFDQPQEVNDVRIVMEKGLAVEGLATCSDDLPASGWRIEAEPTWWRSVRSWPSDDPVAEDGTFRFKHILPGPHRLSVYIPEEDGARGIWSTEVNLPPETNFLDFRIPHPSPHGRVNLSGEVVFIGGDYDRGFWINGESTTGVRGSVYLQAGERRFTITDLVPGLYTLDITIHGKRKEFKNVAVPRDDLLLEIPLDPQITITGRVIDYETDQPVTSFKVGIHNTQDPWRQITDPNGFFTVSSRGYEPIQITVQAEGYGDTISEPITPETAEPTLIRMNVSKPWAGRITNKRGEPIAGATVSYRYKRTPYEDPNGKYITSTDGQGHFRMEVNPLRDSMTWFVFRHPEYARVTAKLDPDEASTSGIHITLPKGGTVQGFAHDWQGEILKNAHVYFMDESHFPYWKENRARLGKVTTDSEGFYRINHLPAELCYAFTGNPMNALGVSLSCVLPREKESRPFDIGGTWRTSGRLLYRDEPLANTRLRLTFEAGVAQGYQAATLSNALGEFSFYGLPTGTRGLYCSIPGDRGRDVWIRLTDISSVTGQDQHLGDLALRLGEVQVELVCEDPSQSTENWDVYLILYDPDHYWGQRIGELASRTSPHDPFVFTNVPMGELEAVATCQNYPTLRRRFTIKTEASRQSLTLTIPSGSASFSGRVISDRLYGGQTSFILRNPDQSITASIKADAQGQFHVENLPAGHCIAGKVGVAKARQSVLLEMTLRAGEHKTKTESRVLPEQLEGSPCPV